MDSMPTDNTPRTVDTVSRVAPKERVQGLVDYTKVLHVLSTVWFVTCLAFLLVAGLRERGVNWWVIFSLSGYSAVLVFVLVSLYLFALFRGVSRTQRLQPEHPLTCSRNYMMLYAAAPFLGGLAGCLSGLGLEEGGDLVHRATLGTFGMTFAFWVVLDPSIAVLEGLLPPSRRHRAQRMARYEAERQEREAKRQKVLAEVLEKEKKHRALWEKTLRPYARELAGLMRTDIDGFVQAKSRAVELGAEAWRLGGIACMRQLHEMAMSPAEPSTAGSPIADYLSYWWDGIGTWRGPNS
jgi:hypothetical protein